MRHNIGPSTIMIDNGNQYFKKKILIFIVPSVKFLWMDENYQCQHVVMVVVVRELHDS
jgi:hypothetical protein